MRPVVMVAGVALALGLFPAESQAACNKRTTGTVLGAVTGGLLGHAVAGRGSHTEGTLLGAAAGGFVGNQVTKCKRARYSYQAPRRSYARPTSVASRDSVCRYETRAFYDPTGQLVYAPTRVCG